MLGVLSHTRVLRLAGLFTWVMVGLPLAYSQFENLHSRSDMGSWAILLFVAYLSFGAAYYWLTRLLRSDSDSHTTWLDRGLLLLLTVSALGVSYLSGSGLGSILMMVAAGVIPWMLSARLCVLWLLVSQLAVAPVYYMLLHFPLFEAVMQSLLYGGFSMFIFVTSLVARQQTQARDEQRRLNSELRATRALLAESARVNERTRISRELHDLLGHQLTALTLNLEVAGHLAEGQALDHVKRSHALAKLLLGNVREVVSQLRETGAIDLAAALRPLTENVPSLDIQLDIEDPLNVEDPQRAHVLLRCTQEIITNAVRHAGARHLWIKVYREAPDRVVVEARDDGVGADMVNVGNGLRGMRERLQQCGGQLQVETRPGEGFRLRATVPATVLVAALTKVPEGVR
ncbi:TPA: sensor histidine kinase [Stenotrophomonas maltophilia]|jgi:signal transduction histidine kinase|uniref:Sensor histidine kinase n=2 Tax=Stenotrophomonas TaxID=40323 RepID=A0AAP5C3P0_9GAMM|nr:MULTISPECIES: sensor histidine kinase [Stenotrophomonas]MBH1407047.1 sensor histidine kinase [Stenotrophomonas maltophilia]MBH1447016.1 sensor histidine kinase [Stenotrophomonas maltophilia]MBH1641101.1 sensor histidine kinase [Stenotrophomonas maltophilia]MBH1838170.1 sensor histidine kinase [Stenotrophomonas maltophilia]MBN4971832.1 sensor histidine kinase [Stenotrophomonas maltophilia]